MATTISTQDIVDAKRDIEDIGKAVNEKVIVSPRYGDDFKSLPMIAEEGQASIASFNSSAQAKISEWDSAIDLITQEGGIPALAVSDASSENQQTVNLKGAAIWYERPAGYFTGDTARLANGDIVKSTINGNTNNPNTDMTGWADTSAAQNIKNSLGGSVQEFIDQQIETNTLLKNISVTPETYGAVGDGVTDDTIAVKAWWESQIVYKQARGKYKINLGTSGTTHTTDKSLFVDMVGAEFIPTAQAGYLLQVNYTGVGGVIEVRGGHFSSNDLIVRPLRIYGSGRVKQCIIKYNSATDVKENGQGYTAAALIVNVSSDLTLIQGNAYDGVSRTTDNAGLVACAGISVTEIDATCIIHGNSIKNIKSLNDTDADGVIAFTSNRLVTPSELQRVNIHITGNSFTDCQGRYVKAQGPAKVYSNYFEAISLPLITAFRAVDAQFGGVQCFDNIWRLSAGLRTLGGETAFYFYNGKGDTGSEENVGYCRDNILFLADDIRYLAFVQGSGGKHSVVIKDNIIKDEDGLTKVSQLVRLNILDSSAIGSMDLSIESNIYTSRLADLLILTGAGFGQAALNDKLRLTIAGNKPKNITNGARLIRTTPEANNPYMGDFLICNNGNQTANYNTLVARGLDLNKLRRGNSFYYENDGSGAGTSGLINAPTGYSRSVFVDVKSTIEITKFTGDKKAVKAGAAGWYEYTGVLLT